jgi:murein L,D-transpeptidase YafK
VVIAFLVSALLLVALPATVSAQPGADLAQNWKADRVLVVKNERRLYLIRNHKVLRSYAIALGRSPVGHKVFEGDGRTPEGLYVLDRKNTVSRFYRSIHISYPSEVDIAEARVYGGRPGGLVMIHGQPSNGRNGHHGYRPWDWTEGCIAVSNAEMDEIWMATDEGTPIEILP